MNHWHYVRRYDVWDVYVGGNNWNSYVWSDNWNFYLSIRYRSLYLRLNSRNFYIRSLDIKIDNRRPALENRPVPKENR